MTLANKIVKLSTSSTNIIFLKNNKRNNNMMKHLVLRNIRYYRIIRVLNIII